MTPTTQQAKSLTDGRELTLAAANIVYDPKGIEMIKMALDNTKNKEAVVGAVAMAAATILHKMDRSQTSRRGSVGQDGCCTFRPRYGHYL